jgi:DNA modification methylase
VASHQKSISSNHTIKVTNMQTEHRIILADSQHMPELPDNTVHLMITSPPYPMIKMWDTQFGQANVEIARLWQALRADPREETVTRLYEAMHAYLAEVWRETYRVLVEGGIVCVNIGDATRTLNGAFRLFPNHSRIIEHCTRIGFTTLPYILWKKPTTKPKYKGKGAFLGSGFLPPNAYVTLDCEYILIFRKGKLRQFPSHDHCRYRSKLTKTQRDAWFTQIWTVTGTRQTASQVERRTAAFPLEIADRLIRMFSVEGDLVLDPFLGSGTTTEAAMRAERNSVGYEKDETLLPLIEKRLSARPETCKLSVTRRGS